MLGRCAEIIRRVCAAQRGGPSHRRKEPRRREQGRMRVEGAGVEGQRLRSELGLQKPLLDVKHLKINSKTSFGVRIAFKC